MFKKKIIFVIPLLFMMGCVADKGAGIGKPCENANENSNSKEVARLKITVTKTGIIIDSKISPVIEYKKGDDVKKNIPQWRLVISECVDGYKAIKPNCNHSIIRCPFYAGREDYLRKSWALYTRDFKEFKNQKGKIFLTCFLMPLKNGLIQNTKIFSKTVVLFSDDIPFKEGQIYQAKVLQSGKIIVEQKFK